MFIYIYIYIYSNLFLCFCSKLVRAFKNSKFSVILSDQNLDEHKDGTKFNLKDEGIEIEQIYVNGGFAEYEHDIGIPYCTKYIKHSFFLY